MPLEVSSNCYNRKVILHPFTVHLYMQISGRNGKWINKVSEMECLCLSACVCVCVWVSECVRVQGYPVISGTVAFHLLYFEAEDDRSGLLSCLCWPINTSWNEKIEVGIQYVIALHTRRWVEWCREGSRVWGRLIMIHHCYSNPFPCLSELTRASPTLNDKQTNTRGK